MSTEGDAVNVVPPSAEIHVDCRVLPGQTEEDVLRELERGAAGCRGRLVGAVLLGDAGQPLRAGRRAVRRDRGDARTSSIPGARIVAELGSWFTDSAHVRAAFPGAVAYGFCPFVRVDFRDVAPRLHGLDERVAVEDLLLQTEFFERLAARVTA